MREEANSPHKDEEEGGACISRVSFSRLHASVVDTGAG